MLMTSAAIPQLQVGKDVPQQKKAGGLIQDSSGPWKRHGFEGSESACKPFGKVGQA